MWCWVWMALGALDASAQEAITYEDALAASVRHHPSVRVAEARRDQARGGLLGANALYDPLYRLSGDWRRSENQGFFQGFPFESQIKSWSVNQSVSGRTGTGTQYELNIGVDRDINEFQTDFGLFEETQLQDAYRGNLNVALTQQLLRGLRFGYNVQNVTRSRRTLTQSELELVRQRQQAMVEVANAYWVWSYNVELQSISEEGVAVAGEALRVGKIRAEAGHIAPVEATRLEAAWVQAQQDALVAANAAEQSANALLIGMGRPTGQDIVPGTAAAHGPTQELDAARVLAVAREQNLDIALARHALETSEFEHKNAKHGVLPSLAVSGSLGVRSQRCPIGTDDADCVLGGIDDALTGLFADDNQPYATLGAVFEVPLGNRSARGSRNQLEAVVWERQRQLDEQEQRVSAAVEEQLLTLRSAAQRIELADTQVRLAAETLEAEEALAEAGRTLLKDVLEARTELQRAKVEAAKARTDVRVAQARLLMLQGQLTE